VVSGNTFESKDAKGYRTITHDMDVPDRLPHEPHGIRAQAKETAPNSWNVSVIHGPHDTKDESGSYYKHISNTQFSGPLGKVKSGLKRSVSESWKGVQGAR
jgi:hypothetical protein